MKHYLFNVFVGLTLVLGLLSSCGGNKSKDGRTDTYSSGAMPFASDESFSPIIDEEKELFEYTYPEATLTPIYTNEVDEVKQLLDLKVFLAITTRRATPAEVEKMRQKNYILKSIPIGYDGLALIINNENPDSCISVKDIKRILSGEAKNWNDVFPNSKLGKLDVVFDNPESSTVRYCVDSLLGGKPISSPNVEAVKTSAEVINYVSSHKSALGIIGSNWLNDKRDTTNVTFKKEIRVMAVSRLDSAVRSNSWKPYQGYLYNGNYPLVRTIYALLSDPRSGLPTGFLNFITSPKGQLILFKSGLLPARGQVQVRDVEVKSE